MISGSTVSSRFFSQAFWTSALCLSGKIFPLYSSAETTPEGLM